MTELRSATRVALAGISGDIGGGMTIRHGSVRGACIRCAFFQLLFFRVANDFLEVLARGDIKENLPLLKQNPVTDADGACTMRSSYHCLRTVPLSSSLLASACCCISAWIRLRANLVMVDPLASTGYILTPVPRSSPSVRPRIHPGRFFSKDPDDMRTAKLLQQKAHVQRKLFGHTSGCRAFFCERYQCAAGATKEEKVSRGTIT